MLDKSDVSHAIDGFVNCFFFHFHFSLTRNKIYAAAQCPSYYSQENRNTRKAEEPDARPVAVASNRCHDE